jgi:hypothetical protein
MRSKPLTTSLLIIVLSFGGCASTPDSITHHPQWQDPPVSTRTPLPPDHNKIDIYVYPQQGAVSAGAYYRLPLASPQTVGTETRPTPE